MTAGLRSDVADADLARRRAAAGRAIVRRLYVALSAVESGSTESLGHVFGELSQSLGEAREIFAGEAELALRGRGLAIDGVRVGLESQSFGAVEALRAVMMQRGYGRLRLRLEVDRDTAEAGLRALLKAPLPTAHDAGAPADPAWIVGLPASECDSVLHGDESMRVGTWVGDGSSLRTVYLAKVLLDQVGDARLGVPRLAKSVLNVVANTVLQRPALVSLLADLEGAGAQLVQQGATTAVYTVLIGRRLGLPRRVLLDTGVAALFHAIGRAVDGEGDVAERGWRRLMGADRCSAVLRAMHVVRRLDDPVDDARLLDFEADVMLPAIVRTASWFDRHAAQVPVDDAFVRLRRDAAAGLVPDLLVSALEGAFESGLVLRTSGSEH